MTAKQKIMQFAIAAGVFRSKAVQRYCSLSDSHTRRYIAELRAEGMLQKVDSRGRTSLYAPTRKALFIAGSNTSRIDFKNDLNIAVDLVLCTFSNVEFITHKADVAQALHQVNMEDAGRSFPLQKIIGRDTETGKLFLFIKKGSNRYKLKSDFISQVFSAHEEVVTYILYFSSCPFSAFAEKLQEFTQEKDQVEDESSAWVKHSFTRPDVEKDFLKRELKSRQQEGWIPMQRNDKNVCLLTVYGEQVKQVYPCKCSE